MFVTITSLKLKSFWGFFKLSLLGLKVSNQAKTEKGFLAMKNTGFGYNHYTATLWQSEEDLKRFARSGAHLEAMKLTSALAQEVRIHTFSATHIPDWKEAKRLIQTNGKVLTYK